MFDYEGYTQKDLEVLLSNLIAACYIMEDMRMADVMLYDNTKWPEYINHMNCIKHEHETKELETVVFMFVWSEHDVEYMPLFKSNINYIIKGYTYIFNKYFTEDTLTPDCSGIMLFLDRLKKDVLEHKVPESVINELHWLVGDLNSLSSYPSLNDQEMYEIENLEFDDTWDDYGYEDMVNLIEQTVNKLLEMQGSDYAVSLDLDESCEYQVLELFWSLAEEFYGGEGYIIESSGVYIRIPDVGEAITKIDKFRDKLLEIIDCTENKEDKAKAFSAISQKTMKQVLTG